MSKRYVICLTAANRTGILAAVSTALSELGGDIDEIGHAAVTGFFVMIMAADFPGHRDAEVIVSHLEGVCQLFGATVILKDPECEFVADEPLAGGEQYTLTLTGHDAPGIVARISGRLAREAIDITELRGARHTDGLSFTLVMELAIPSGSDMASLQKDLEELGASLGLTTQLARTVA